MMHTSIQSWVKVICVAAFVVSALFPDYAPEGAYGAGPEHYLTNNQFLLVEEGFVMKTASITEQGHRIAYGKGISHKVGSGESMNFLADLYRISVETIRYANNLSDSDVIHPGQSLIILPVDGILHTVQRGQNVMKIAALYNVPAENIIAQNQLEEGKILAGQQIIVPGGRPIIHIDVAPDLSPPGRPGVEPSPPRPTSPPEAIAPASYGVLQKPCDCTYTQYFHPGHYAVDLSRTGGGAIFASEDGIISRAEYGWNGGYGNVVEIDHGSGLKTLYAHNKELHVREGDTVHRGDVISTMGATGRVYGKTGIHLHFEVILEGVKKNPLLYLQ